MRGVRASEIIVVKSESGQYISTGLTSSLGLFSLIYWPLSLFTPLRSLLWKVISEALTRGHKFILFSHHQYNQYKALLCSCSPISISAFMAFLGYFWFWMGDIEVVRWNGVDFLVPKHLRKSKIGLLEQIWAKTPYVTFFWVTLYINMWLKYMSFFFGIGNEWICYKSFEMGWSCAITELSETLYWIPSKEYIRSLKVIGDPANYKSHPYWWQNT